VKEKLDCISTMVYCTQSNQNWYYSVAWNMCYQPGIYPTGNPIECYNECIKGTSQADWLVELSVNHEAFFNRSLPSIARDVYYERSGFSQAIASVVPISTVNLFAALFWMTKLTVSKLVQIIG
jgi:hypothetical protein